MSISSSSLTKVFLAQWLDSTGVQHVNKPILKHKVHLRLVLMRSEEISTFWSVWFHLNVVQLTQRQQNKTADCMAMEISRLLCGSLEMDTNNSHSLSLFICYSLGQHGASWYRRNSHVNHALIYLDNLINSNKNNLKLTTAHTKSTVSKYLVYFYVTEIFLSES